MSSRRRSPRCRPRGHHECRWPPQSAGPRSGPDAAGTPSPPGGSVNRRIGRGSGPRLVSYHGTGVPFQEKNSPEGPSSGSGASRTAPGAASAGRPPLAAAVPLRAVRRRPGSTALVATEVGRCRLVRHGRGSSGRRRTVALSHWLASRASSTCRRCSSRGWPSRLLGLADAVSDAVLVHDDPSGLHDARLMPGPGSRSRGDG
jgi:hypothetical protein